MDKQQEKYEFLFTLLAIFLGYFYDRPRSLTVVMSSEIRIHFTEHAELLFQPNLQELKQLIVSRLIKNRCGQAEQLSCKGSEHW